MLKTTLQLAKTACGDRPIKIYYDFSKFVDYLFLQGPTGIARVDLAYAEYLEENPQHFAAGKHTRYLMPTRFSHRTLKRLIRLIKKHWNEENKVAVGEQVQLWLRGLLKTRRIDNGVTQRRVFIGKVGVLSLNWPYHNIFSRVPHGSYYLNTSYARLKFPNYLTWLEKRRDIKAVFMVHDLIPLTRPDLFWDGHLAVFCFQIDQIIKFAHLVIVPSATVKEALSRYAAESGDADLRIEILHTPPAHHFLLPPTGASVPVGTPYFVMCGTLEPRKNHVFILQVWRTMLKKKLPTPKLVLVGGRGWKNELLFRDLESAIDLDGYVVEVANLSTSDLRDLIASSNGLLLPSLDEGYGMPVVEALSVGCPCVCSDLAVFHEVSQGKAIGLPLDAEAWISEVQNLAYDNQYLHSARGLAMSFVPNTWAKYFTSLLCLLSEESFDDNEQCTKSAL